MLPVRDDPRGFPPYWRELSKEEIALLALEDCQPAARRIHQAQMFKRLVRAHTKAELIDLVETDRIEAAFLSRSPVLADRARASFLDPSLPLPKERYQLYRNGIPWVLVYADNSCVVGEHTEEAYADFEDYLGTLEGPDGDRPLASSTILIIPGDAAAGVDVEEICSTMRELGAKNVAVFTWEEE